MRNKLIPIALGLAFIFTSCVKDAEKLDESGYDQRLSGGSNTVFSEGSGAFGATFEGLSAHDEFVHEVGDVNFENTFVTAPAPIRPGLGPLFNNVSCGSCHIGDGRGKAPDFGKPLESMLFRLSVPGTDAHGGPLGAPGFGGQLQDKAVFGKMCEATVSITYTQDVRNFLDGESYVLQVPVYALQNSYIPLPAGIMVSPRVAPNVFGLGLLEAIPENTLLAMADEGDVNGDGISGRANYVWDVKAKKTVIGKFGWKANNPNLLQQTAGAFNQDMGITTNFFLEESSYGQSQWDATQAQKAEIADSVLDAVAFYMRTLQVPARRNVKDPEIIKGEGLFTASMCGKCHAPSMRTATNIAFPQLSNQLIHPYSDMLLHDMGDGLADNRPDYLATGKEWRTTPLWGIGLTRIVNGHNNFLHDGRARSIMEAIMWHGGEAQRSVDMVTKMNKTDRDALVKFLNSL